MPIYKDPAGGLHELDDAAYEYMLPPGSEQITQEAATRIREEAAPAPGVPDVSRFQARAALYQANLLDTVESIMADPATDPLARMAWKDATEFRRNSPTVAAMQAMLGLSNEDLDGLFQAAASIVA